MSKRKKPLHKKPAPKPARGPKNQKPAATTTEVESTAAPEEGAPTDDATSAVTTEATEALADTTADDTLAATEPLDDDPDAPSPEPLDDDPDAPSPEPLDDDSDAPSPEPLAASADHPADTSDLDETREQSVAKPSASDSDPDADADPVTPRPAKLPVPSDDELEFPSVPSEGRPRGIGPNDEDDLTTTVVWTGASKRSSTGDLDDDGDDDDVIVSSLGARSQNAIADDLEVTVNLTADLLPVQERDDLSEPTSTALPDEDDVTRTSLPAPSEDGVTVTHQHLRGLIEALVFASDRPLRAGELARRAQAPAKEIKQLLGELRAIYTGRGIQLDEVGSAFVFRTNPIYAPFVRELTGQKPVKLTRTQVETLSILAYRQPITRPEIDDIRGVDSGPVLKMLLERDLIKILGKKDEPGRPILYGTTPQFLEFFGIPSLKDLPTLREFTELNDDSKRVVERELGESYESVQASLAEESAEHMATNDLGAFEPEEEGAIPESAASASRVDEALREIERASLEGDPDDDGPEIPVPVEDRSDSASDDDDDSLDPDLSLDDDETKDDADTAEGNDIAPKDDEDDVESDEPKDDEPEDDDVEGDDDDVASDEPKDDDAT